MSHKDSKAALAWRQSLKPGDTVVIGKLGRHRNLWTRVVSKMTTTQIVLDCGRRFSIRYGKPIGDRAGIDMFELDEYTRQHLKAQQYRRDFAVITSGRTELTDDEVIAMVDAYNIAKHLKESAGAAA